MSRTSLVLGLGLLLAAVAMSGCLGGDGDEKPPSAQGRTETPGESPRTGGEPVASPTRGALEATVTDESFNPLAGARVTIIDPKLSDGSHLAAMTGEDGKAAFSDLDPGPYRLVAEKLPYDSVGRAVSVEAGKIASVVFPLPELDVEEAPRVEPYEFNGFFGCGAAVRWGKHVEDRPNQPSVPAGISLNPCAADPNNANVHEFDLGAEVATLVVAVTWNPTGGVVGRELSVSVETRDCDAACPNDETYGEQVAETPIVIRVEGENLTKPQPIPANGTAPLRVRVFPGANEDGEFSVFFQQSFKIYVNVFYVEPAPPDFTGIPE